MKAHLTLLLVATVVLAAAASQAATLTATTDPPGAEVMWSLDHDPVLRLAGLAPATLQVPEHREVTVCVRRDGYWPCWRRLPVSGDGTLRMRLRRRLRPGAAGQPRIRVARRPDVGLVSPQRPLVA
jgi:hypothetical protein